MTPVTCPLRIITIVFVHDGREAHTGVCMWKTEDSLVELGLSSHLYMGSVDLSSTARLEWQVLLSTEPSHQPKNHLFLT